MVSNKEVEKNVLHSTYPEIPLPHLSSNSAVDYILERSQDNVRNGVVNWMTDTVTGDKVTLPELDPMSRQVASAMVKRGMAKGDVAIYITSDVTRIFTIVAGVWRVGGIMYSSYPEDTTDTLLMRINESNARWVFCDPISVPQVKAAQNLVDWPVEILVFGDVDGTTSVDDLFLDDGSQCPEKVPDAKLDDPILILCTSGTTGLSKGAVYSNRSMIAFFVSFTGMPLTPQPVFFLLRCTHVLGILLPFRCACFTNHAVMMSQITKQNIFKAVHDYKPTFAFGFPTFLMALAVDPEGAQYDFSSLESVCTGGMVIPEHYYLAMKRLPNIKHLLNGFGLTECGVLTSTIDQSDISLREVKAVANHPPMTVGRLLPNTSLKVVHIETGETLGPLERGELVVKNPIMAIGYWNRPEETAATFQDGWMKTGDLGYYDEAGWLFIVDRIKETFKYFNNHICPAEVEAELTRHPAVAEACVFGIVDENGGDHIPRGLVILKPGQIATSTEIQEFANSKLAEYKKLRGGVYIVESLPRGKTGKVLRLAAAKLPLPTN